jgi:hypothetical protein
MVTREHTLSGHTRRFTVTRGTVGWEVREEQDSQTVRLTTYRDWHRVERALQMFDVDMRDRADVHSTNR